MDSASVGSEILADRYPEIAFLLNFSFQNSTEEPQVDAPLAFKLEGIDLIYLYGIGSGENYPYLKEWLKEKEERMLIVLEEELQAIAYFLQTPHASDFLSNPQVDLRFIPEKKAWKPILEELVETFPVQRIDVLATRSYAKRKKYRLGVLRLQLLRASTISHALASEVLYSHRLLRNLIPNAFRWPNSFFANELKNAFQGVPAVICGAGPSLSKTIDCLKTLEDRALIIAGGSTIASLSNQGVIPHIGMALDPNAEEFGRLKAASSFEMPLLYATRLEPRVFNTCNGERGYLISQTGGTCEAYFEKTAGIEGEAVGPALGSEALSITTLAVALAVHLGCDPIILNGVDLAYTGMNRYASGVMPCSKVSSREMAKEKRAGERLLKRKDIYGKPIFTSLKWVMESQCIGSYAKTTTSSRFFNATEGGLGFPGIPNRSLEEVIEEHLLLPQDLRARVHAAIQPLKFSKEIKGSLVQMICDLKKSLEQLKALAEQMLQELKRLRENPALNLPTGKMAIVESDFCDEIAFTHLLPLLGPALDQLMARIFYVSPFASDEEKRICQIKKQTAKWQKFQESIEETLVLFGQF